jgi:cellulose synthase/poly-beta-1,6-N-acetylglucosamine synthase-like glycosyltransferase
MSVPLIFLAGIHGLLFYTWLVFPGLLWFWRRSPGREDHCGPQPPAGVPEVALVLSAYNEEDHIRQRIENLLSLDYPPDKLRVYVGVDGARDGTAREAQAAAEGHRQVVVTSFARNRGKVTVLKDIVAQAKSAEPHPDVLVFTDANTGFAPDALRRLCAPFSDPAVGGVCGKLVFIRNKGGETEENVYWKLENWLKARESDLDSCLGANGAIYAIRSGLFWDEIPTNTIIDDFVIGMKVREALQRMVYEPSAVATEELPAQVADEWKRRVRIGAGDFQALFLCRRCLSPAFGAFAWTFWSHKVLRWFTPHLLILGLVSAGIIAALERAPLAFAILAGYAGLALAALAGLGCKNRPGLLCKLFRSVHYLLAMQAAILAGFLRFCRGNLEGRWDRTSRK